MTEHYEICEECGAVAHGNLFCNTCRKVMNERNGLHLPELNHPAESPCGPEEIQAFLAKLDTADLKDHEMLVGVHV